MIEKTDILSRIKKIVDTIEPDAQVILFGSFARGDNHKYSDIDILILIKKDKVSYSDEQRIKYPLYDLEFETGNIISPIVYSRNEWETEHQITPFYKNVKREGILL